MRVLRHYNGGPGSVKGRRPRRSLDGPPVPSASSLTTGTSAPWIDGELWHATWKGDESDLRRVDPRTVRSSRKARDTARSGASGLESGGGDPVRCGVGKSV